MAENRHSDKWNRNDNPEIHQLYNQLIFQQICQKFKAGGKTVFLVNYARIIGYMYMYICTYTHTHTNESQPSHYTIPEK